MFLYWDRCVRVVIEIYEGAKGISKLESSGVEVSWNSMSACGIVRPHVPLLRAPEGDSE